MIATPASEVNPILVVEDDADLREVLAESLRLEGHEVLEAVDGLDAFQRLLGGARPALVVLDLVMPRMDGRQLLTAMRADAALAAIPVVLVTGTPPRDLAEAVDAILKKPIGIKDLLRCIERRGAGSGPRIPASAGAACA